MSSDCEVGESRSRAQRFNSVSVKLRYRFLLLLLTRRSISYFVAMSYQPLTLGRNGLKLDLPTGITPEVRLGRALGAADSSQRTHVLDWPSTPAPTHANDRAARADFPPASPNAKAPRSISSMERGFGAPEDGFTSTEHGTASRERGFATKEHSFCLKTLPCFLLSHPAVES